MMGYLQHIASLIEKKIKNEKTIGFVYNQVHISEGGKKTLSFDSDDLNG